MHWDGDEFWNDLCTIEHIHVLLILRKALWDFSRFPCKAHWLCDCGSIKIVLDSRNTISVWRTAIFVISRCVLDWLFRWTNWSKVSRLHTFEQFTHINMTVLHLWPYSYTYPAIGSYWKPGKGPNVWHTNFTFWCHVVPIAEKLGKEPSSLLAFLGTSSILQGAFTGATARHSKEISNSSWNPAMNRFHKTKHVLRCVDWFHFCS